MAATVVPNKRTKMAAMYCVVTDITLDASYPTGGYTITPAQFGLTTFDFVLAAPSNGYTATFSDATQKLIVYSTAATQVTAATNLAAVVVRVLAMGT